MQSGYVQILPDTQQQHARARAVDASLGASTVPLSTRRQAYPGVDGVLSAASKLVTKYTGDERIRSLALKITSTIRRHRLTGQPDLRNIDAIASAIYKWMVRNVNYVRDPWDVERIQSPFVTITQRAGDCDDHAILGAALMQSLGIQTGFRIVSRTGRHFDHIYAVYQSPTGWKSFDTTVLKYPGYVFDERLIKKSRHVTNLMPEGLGLDPITLLTTATTMASTGMTLKNTLSSIFGAKDSGERQMRGALRDHLMQRGVQSEVISLSQKDNATLQRYAQIIDELGAPAVQQLNRYGQLSPVWVTQQQAANKTKKMGLYAGLAIGTLVLIGGGYMLLNK
jgi:hypothetical protein